MIISHSDTPQTWTISGGTAPAFLDASDAYIDDGDPQTVCRFRWNSDAQTLSTNVQLKATFLVEKRVRMLGIIGTTLPVGTLVEFAIWNGLSFNMYESARVIQGPRGQRGVFVYVDTYSDGIEARIIIYNDVNGVASIAASSIFEIGEIWSGDADILETDGDGYTIVDIDPINVVRSVSSRAARRRTTLTHRRFAANLDTREIVDWVGSDNLRQVLAKIDRNQTCVVVPRHLIAGVYSSDALNATAIFGIATSVPGVVHIGGDTLDTTGDLVIEEVPALPA